MIHGIGETHLRISEVRADDELNTLELVFTRPIRNTKRDDEEF